MPYIDKIDFGDGVEREFKASGGGGGSVKYNNAFPSLDKWSAKMWNGYPIINGSNTWTDGDNIYYSQVAYQYVLDKAASTWTAK